MNNFNKRRKRSCGTREEGGVVPEKPQAERKKGDEHTGILKDSVPPRWDWFRGLAAGFPCRNRRCLTGEDVPGLQPNTSGIELNSPFVQSMEDTDSEGGTNLGDATNDSINDSSVFEEEEETPKQSYIRWTTEAETHLLCKVIQFRPMGPNGNANMEQLVVEMSRIKEGDEFTYYADVLNKVDYAVYQQRVKNKLIEVGPRSYSPVWTIRPTRDQIYAKLNEFFNMEQFLLREPLDESENKMMDTGEELEEEEEPKTPASFKKPQGSTTTPSSKRRRRARRYSRRH
uniref:MBD domain-containing protein n=1 Tax=Steinernema glaseri TaxID=37863 RepID=A0A1I7YJ50_9BILA